MVWCCPSAGAGCELAMSPIGLWVKILVSADGGMKGDLAEWVEKLIFKAAIHEEMP